MRSLLADQRQLTEVVARADPSDLHPSDTDGCGSFGDHEETDTTHPILLDDRRTRLELTLAKMLRKPLQLPVAETAEERNLLQVVADAGRASAPVREFGA